MRFFIFLFLLSTNAFACNFCMLGQGVNPYLTGSNQGLTIAADYASSDTTYIGKSEVAGNGKKETWNTYSLTGFFSPLSDLTILITLPYASKTNIDYDSGSSLNTGTVVEGFGDVSVTGRYTLLTEHSIESTFVLGVLGGVKAPTGSTSIYAIGGAAVDRHVLPGTGSWDFDTGISSSYAKASGFQATLDAVYRFAGKGLWAGREHRFGDSLNYGAKLYQRVLRTEAGASFFPFLGISGETTGKETGAVLADSSYSTSTKNPSTGGTVLFANLGVYAPLSANTILNLGYAKAFYHQMNYDANFDADPAEKFRLNFSLTYLL